jgi:hypothetical protein
MLRSGVLSLALCATGLPVAGQDARTEVDLLLVLAVDVSRSISPAELDLQRRGYAEALTSRDVLGAIGGGFLGRIGLSYLEWAGDGTQRLVVDWTLIETPDQAAEFADALLLSDGPTMRRTSISGALIAGREQLRLSPFTAMRQVIDVSGDGPNNQGLPVTEARDAVVADGITVNGLPLMTRDGMGSAWHLDDLDRYYAACVIGGPGAFVVPVRDWTEFAEAVRRKLVLEISGLAAIGLTHAQAAAAAGYDCLVGEKIWQRNMRDWEFQ